MISCWVEKSKYNTLSSRWYSEVDVTHKPEGSNNKVSTLLEVTLPSNWYSDLALYGYTCAFAGYQFGTTEYDLRPAERVVESPSKYGDLAIEYLVSREHGTLQDLINDLEYNGCSVSVIPTDKLGDE